MFRDAFAMINSKRLVDLSATNLFELIIANASLNIFREKEQKFSLSGLNVMHPSRFDQNW